MNRIHCDGGLTVAYAAVGACAGKTCTESRHINLPCIRSGRDKVQIAALHVKCIVKVRIIVDGYGNRCGK